MITKEDLEWVTSRLKGVARKYVTIEHDKLVAVIECDVIVNTWVKDILKLGDLK